MCQLTGGGLVRVPATYRTNCSSWLHDGRHSSAVGCAQDDDRARPQGRVPPTRKGPVAAYQGMSTASSHSTSNLLPGDCPTLTAESPDDLLAVIPYLLGYHPDESLVLVLIDHRSVTLCARIDLRNGPDAAVRAGEAADGLAGIVRAHQATGAIVVAYSSDHRLASIFLDSTIERLTDGGVICRRATVVVTIVRP